jgi:phosphotransferase system  glucose/maltose/N-acetylglucosamine-specific IIC component
MNKNILMIVSLGLLLLIPEYLYAKDVVQALRQSETKAGEIFMSLGPIALIASGVAFQFSKQLGGSLLLGSLIGIAIFAGRNGIFNMLLGIFS